MKTLTTEQLAEIFQRAATATERGPDGSSKNKIVAGMQAALDAYHASFGEGLPSVEEIHASWSKGHSGTEGWENVRNLMLSAFSRQMGEKYKALEGLRQVAQNLQALLTESDGEDVRLINAECERLRRELLTTKIAYNASRDGRDEDAKQLAALTKQLAAIKLIVAKEAQP